VDKEPEQPVGNEDSSQDCLVAFGEAYRARVQDELAKTVEDIVGALQVLDDPSDEALGDNGEDLAGWLDCSDPAVEGGEAAEDAAEGADAEGEANEAADGDGETIEARLRSKLAVHTEALMDGLEQLEREEADICSLEMQDLVSDATEMLSEMEGAEAEIRLLRNLCDMLSQQKQQQKKKKKKDEKSGAVSRSAAADSQEQQ
ncbi:hypothetical protein BOX15_Mlig016233g2, partial [Macrostomum lignano]